VACLLAALLALGGCSQPSWSSINPINWWHGLEGGAIAQQRPPPPGANQPGPNLASVPPKPEEPDRAALQDISDALIADRANAQRMAAAAPLADPSSPSASPDLFGVGAVPPPGPPPPAGAAPAASATLPAANAPPARSGPTAQAPAQLNTPASTPAAPPAKAPVGAVASNPLPEPSPPPAPLSVGPALPPLPTAPPAPANVAGIPAAATVPAAPAAPKESAPATAPAVPTATAMAPPPAAPVPSPAALTPAALTPAAPTPAPVAKPGPTAMASLTPSGEPVSSGNTVAVVFANGISAMPPSSSAPLHTLAGKRGNGLIAVTGYGDAADASPDAQAAALKLGLARAQAIASALVADGVPASAVQIDAQAMGRGGTARLVK
jgi:outer membrane protein OmpA-like peptidoglycan-associated protein